MKHLSRKSTLIAFLIITLLAACTKPAPTPAPAQIPTAVPTPSSIPTTIIPSLSAPIPTPEPSFAEADLALSFGDYQTALTSYQQIHTASTPELQAASLFGQALVYLNLEEYDQALTQIAALQDAYPDTLPAKRAFILQAQAHLARNEDDQALVSWQAYLSARPGILDAYVYEEIGDIYRAQGKNDAALDAYKSAYLSPVLCENFCAGTKVADTYNALGQAETAIQIYRDQYNQSDNILEKAQIDLLIGRIHVNMGNPSEGYTYYQDAVNNYPNTYDAYSALAALVDAGEPVDEVQRGLINYNVGQYELAIEAFDRYLAGEGTEKDKALYYKALAVRAEGAERTGLYSEERFQYNQQGGTPEDQQAIQLWRDVAELYPHGIYVEDAIEDIVYTQQFYLQDNILAAETALDYVSRLPQATYAPSLIFTAGRYYEIEGELALAAAAWDRLGTDYPSAEEAFQGTFFAGILHYRQGKFDQAALSFNRSLILGQAPLEQAAAYLWLGKLQEVNGDTEKAAQYWNSAAQADPNGYYGLRANELLGNGTIFTAPSNLNFNVDMAREREIAASWLRTTFNLPAQTQLDYDETLFSDPRFVRGYEYYRLGMFVEAEYEFESLRAEVDKDAANSFRLLKVFLDTGFYRSAITTSQTIVKLAGFSNSTLSPTLPAYFDHVHFGAYYLPWLENAAERYNVPILLLLSVIQQESRFDGRAASGAGALGLMQILPSTAATIASEINYPPNFTEADLGIPFYNLTLGTNYLSRQLVFFDNKIYAALAAYNGGPGSAIEWRNVAGDDPDVFLGTVRFLETRNYVRIIAEFYAQYLRVYGN